MEFGGTLDARVREIKCRISPILNKGHKISITLIVRKGTTNSNIFLEEFYIEPHLIKRIQTEEDGSKSQDSMSDDEFVSADD